MRNIPVELRKHYEEQGWWTQDTLGELLARGLAANPDTGFWVHSDVRPYQRTFRDVELMARRLAAGLRARGVGPGDIVAFQLPNWVEAAVTFWASAFLGAVVVPIVHFYGRKELAYIIDTVKPKVFISTAHFRHMEFHPDLCADIPIVGLVGGDFDDLLADEPMSGELHTDPAAPTLIAFTSGTTRDPKGVVHSHQTLSCETRQLLANYATDRGRQITATPVGHFIGMVGAFLIPVIEGAPVDLCDVFDPGRVLELMESEGMSMGAGRRSSSPACSTTRTSPRHTSSGSSTSASADRRCRPPSPADSPIWASTSSGPMAAPSIRPSPARARTRRRRSGCSPTATSVRAWRSN